MEILFAPGRRLRVLDVVPFEEEDGSRFVGLLLGRGGHGHGYAGLSDLRAYQSSFREEVGRRASDSANRRCRAGGVTVRGARRPFDNVQR